MQTTNPARGKKGSVNTGSTLNKFVLMLPDRWIQGLWLQQENFEQ